MGLTRAEQSARIEAAPSACYEAIADFESYPDWQQAVERIEVLERDEAGRGLVVAVEIDAKVRRVRYRLRYHHDPPSRLWWDYVDGDVAAVEGEFTFEADGAGTIATYRLGVDPGVPLPGVIARRLTGGVMRRVVEDLRRRLEA